MADTIMWSRAKQVNTNLIIKLNGGSTEGTNLFTYNGSGSKSVNITPSSIGAINTAGTGLSKSGTTLNHKVSVTAANRGPTANATISPGGTISVPYIAHDAQGHITSSAARTITLNSNILDTGDIITALRSATSNSKVLGAKVTADNINKLNSNIRNNNLWVKLWSGTARLNTDLILSESIYNFNFVLFYNSTNSIRAILPVLPDLVNIRAGGICVTNQENFGSVGVYGSITQSGKAVRLTSTKYMTHGASTDHSALSDITITSIEGYR